MSSSDASSASTVVGWPSSGVNQSSKYVNLDFSVASLKLAFGWKQSEAWNACVASAGCTFTPDEAENAWMPSEEIVTLTNSSSHLQSMTRTFSKTFNESTETSETISSGISATAKVVFVKRPATKYTGHYTLPTGQVVPEDYTAAQAAATTSTPTPRRSRQPATGPPDSYPDRTSAGKRRRAYKPALNRLRDQPPILSGHTREHRMTSFQRGAHMPVVLALALITTACGDGGGSTTTSSATPTRSDTTRAEVSSQPTGTATSTGFSISSPAMADGGELPVDFTCGGSAISPPIKWADVPDGTRSLAVLMDHHAPDDEWHWYWTLWGIDPAATGLAAGSNGDATVGTNSVNNQLNYAPPCSKGPGKRAYTITVYALSGSADLPDPAAVDREALLAAVDGITLAHDSITVTYTHSS
ncbi:YbhB/YbcL family Raf kinase inhibitor-like protein [Streptomyces sp. HNM0645]|uniref:YbhB/YbcL family Raf kinase inhibitor-like protein n=1 Tax=Streptomyces sp. HNM0645 TaxID=2782343 RepID=UPI0024B83D7C|nr:YbhB/YbcL family Raf kinase inhibitor-like protein [Streptomyces sp. HNM0645]MDI9888455.1 YbhB/YbcL family Raf kinase inhibitor-like protein [Streptomyces sp. HNM0645]